MYRQFFLYGVRLTKYVCRAAGALKQGLIFWPKFPPPKCRAARALTFLRRLSETVAFLRHVARGSRLRTLIQYNCSVRVRAIKKQRFAAMNQPKLYCRNQSSLTFRNNYSCFHLLTGLFKLIIFDTCKDLFQMQSSVTWVSRECNRPTCQHYP